MAVGSNVVRAVALTWLFVAGACAAGGGDARGAADPDPGPPLEGDALAGPREVPRLDGVVAASGYDSGSGLRAWREALPGIEDVRIPSTADGSEQPALWLPPGGDGPAPLLVVLHSWSYGYLQHYGIPFGQLADRLGWAMIHPDFRGPFTGPEATGSDLAVQDVVDAIDHAVSAADVDEDHVYVLGFSGGGMMSLLVAGRHPDRVAGAVSWVPTYDLADWYAYLRRELPDEVYGHQIRASCGGVPEPGTSAADECAARSPRTHLDGARDAGIPVYVGHGLGDPIVPPDHAVRVFNRLAAPDDRLPAAQVEEIGAWRVPDGLDDLVVAEHHFDGADPEVVLALASGPVTLVLFEGRHDMVFHPGVRWVASLVDADR